MPHISYAEATGYAAEYDAYLLLTTTEVVDQSCRLWKAQPDKETLSEQLAGVGGERSAKWLALQCDAPNAATPTVNIDYTNLAANPDWCAWNRTCHAAHVARQAPISCCRYTARMAATADPAKHVNDANKPMRVADFDGLQAEIASLLRPGQRQIWKDKSKQSASNKRHRVDSDIESEEVSYHLHVLTHAERGGFDALLWKYWKIDAKALRGEGVLTRPSSGVTYDDGTRDHSYFRAELELTDAAGESRRALGQPINVRFPGTDTECVDGAEGEDREWCGCHITYFREDFTANWAIVCSDGHRYQADLSGNGEPSRPQDRGQALYNVEWKYCSPDKADACSDLIGPHIIGGGGGWQGVKLANPYMRGLHLLLGKSYKAGLPGAAPLDEHYPKSGATSHGPRVPGIGAAFAPLQFPVALEWDGCFSYEVAFGCKGAYVDADGHGWRKPPGRHALYERV